MSVNYEELLKKEAFSALDDEQKKAFTELANKLSGKNVSESMLIMMDFMKNMPKGQPLSKNEQNAMLDAVLSSLPTDEAAKFQNIMKLLAFNK